MSLPLVTRFGADPLLDLEVANKRYVDAGGGSSPFWGGGSEITGSGNSDLFQGINVGGFSTITNNEESVTGTQIIWKRLTIFVHANSKNADLDTTIQDDGADIVTLTVPSSTTGSFDSGEVTVTTAAASLVNTKVNRSAASSGSYSASIACLGIADES